MKQSKKTVAFYNPSDRKKAERTANILRKQGKTVVIEASKRWGTIDVKTISKKRKPKRINPFSLNLNTSYFK